MKKIIILSVFVVSLFLLGSAWYWKNNISKVEVMGEAIQQEDLLADMAISSKVGMYSKIFFIDEKKGTNIGWLLDKESDEILPTFSPQGDSLAYFSKINGFWVLFLYNFEDNSSNFITVTRETPQKITFSPDGKRILYLEKNNSGLNILYLIEVLTGKMTLVERAVQDPIWSFFGKSFSYVRSENDESNIYLRQLNIDGKILEPELLVAAAKNPIFIDNDEKILFNDLSQSQDNFTLLDLKNREKELLVVFPWKKRTNLSQISLSPQGNLILFGRPVNFYWELGEIWIFDLETRKVRRILTDGFLPLWLDQNKVIYLKNNSLNQKQEVWETDLLGAEKRILLNEGNIFSPTTAKNFTSGDDLSKIIAFEEDLKIKEEWRLSEDEILIDSIRADTNQDGKTENLMVTYTTLDKKIHFYVKDEEKNVLFSNSNFLEYPLALKLENFGEDSFPSYFLLFDFENESGFFLRWKEGEYILTK